MSPKQIKRLQIFIILFLSTLTLYVLFKESSKPISSPIKRKKREFSKQSSKKAITTKVSKKKLAYQKIPIKRKLSEPQQQALDKFREQAKKILDKLPVKADLQNLEGNEVHAIPQELLQTGRELGKLKEIVISFPNFKELQNEAKTYYKNCADQVEYPTSIRSLCLYNRLQLANNNNEKFDISPYPLEIKQLVLELAPFKGP